MHPIRVEYMPYNLYLLRLLAVVLLFVAPVSSWGQSVDFDKVKAEAKSYVDAGVVAQNAGRYEMAVMLYEQAYKLIPHPVLLFNMAQAHRLAGHGELALDLYKRYLRAEPNGSEASNARQFVVELGVHETGKPNKKSDSEKLTNGADGLTVRDANETYQARDERGVRQKPE